MQKELPIRQRHVPLGTIVQQEFSLHYNVQQEHIRIKQGKRCARFVQQDIIVTLNE